MKKNVIKVCAIIILAILFSIPRHVFAVTVNSVNYEDRIRKSAYDIIGVINGGTSIQTTCSNDDGKGYEVYFKVDGTEKVVKNIANGATTNNNDVALTITGTVAADNRTCNVVYHIVNNSTEEKQYAVATTADVQLGENDYAAIYKDSTKKIEITQDDITYDTDYGTQMRISFSPEADTTWIGNYGYRADNKYVNSTISSYTVSDNEDTGLAFSWNGTLAANDEVSYTATYTLSEAPVGNVRFYRAGETTPFYTQVGLVGGSVVTPELSSEAHYTYIWNTSKDGAGTSYDENKGIIIKSGDVDIYEVKTPEEFSITFQSNGGTELDSMDIGYNEELNEPEQPEKDGYIFAGWYSDEKLTQKYEFNKMPAKNFILYAKWIADYKILEGADQTHEINDGKDISVRTNANNSKLAEVRVDGEALGKDNYIVDLETGKITLKAAYLDTLSEGTYTLKMVYTDGEVSTNFKIVSGLEESVSPKTGDNIIVYTTMLAVASFIIIFIRKNSRKFKRRKH